jgi:hypothetical protein
MAFKKLYHFEFTCDYGCGARVVVARFVHENERPEPPDGWTFRRRSLTDGVDVVCGVCRGTEG